MFGSQQFSKVPATLVVTSGDPIRFAGDRFVLDVFVLLSPSLPRDGFLSLGHFRGAPRMMCAYDDRGSWRVSCASADVGGGSGGGGGGGGNGDFFERFDSFSGREYVIKGWDGAGNQITRNVVVNENEHTTDQVSRLPTD